MNSRVFIAYAPQDSAWAEKICGVLEQSGIMCVLCQRDIEAWQTNYNALCKAVAQASVCVVIMSSSANQSALVHSELNCALNNHKTIVRFFVENYSLPRRFGLCLSTHYSVGLEGGEAASLQKLQTVVGGLMATSLPPEIKTESNTAANVAPSACPPPTVSACPPPSASVPMQAQFGQGSVSPVQAPPLPKEKKKGNGLFGALGKLFKGKPQKEAGPETDQVQFRAAAPAVFKKQAYTQLKIMMYREDDDQRADKETAKLGKNVVASSSGIFGIEKGEELRIHLQSPDIDIEDDMQRIFWNGILSECTFEVYVPESYDKSQIRFKGRVYKGLAVLTDIKLIVSVESAQEQVLTVEKCNLATAFVSYASLDRERVVARIQGIQAARRDMDIFMDVEKLRCGEKWESRLFEEIEKRNIFYLFWSVNARNSEWVQKELKYAIEHNGKDSIEPIPLDLPELCPPPDELKERHFNDWTLRYLS